MHYTTNIRNDIIFNNTPKYPERISFLSKSSPLFLSIISFPIIKIVTAAIERVSEIYRVLKNLSNIDSIIEKEFECEYCKKKYKAINNNTNRFCSNKCKSAWRRKSGIDDVEKVCEICGSKFKTNKYSKTKTCSRSCANRLKSKLKDSPNL